MVPVRRPVGVGGASHLGFATAIRSCQSPGAPMLTLPTSQRRAPRQNGEHVPGTLVSLRSVVGPGTGRGDPLGAEGRVSDLILPTGDERREDARRETVVDLVQRELDDLGAEHRRIARRAASLEWTTAF